MMSEEQPVTSPPAPSPGLAGTSVAERALTGLVGSVTALASGDLALAVGTLRGWRAAGRTLLPLADRAWTLLEDAGAPLEASPAIEELRGFLRGSPSDVTSVRTALVAVKAAQTDHATASGPVPGPVEDAWSGLRRAYEQVGDAIRAGDPRGAEDALRGAAAVLVPLRDLAASAPAVDPGVVAPPATSPAPAPEVGVPLEPGPEGDEDPEAGSALPIAGSVPPAPAPEGDEEDALVGPPPAHLAPLEPLAEAEPEGSGADMTGSDPDLDGGPSRPRRGTPRGGRAEAVPWTSIATVLFVVVAMAAAVIWLFVIASS